MLVQDSCGQYIQQEQGLARPGKAPSSGRRSA